jgi:hypothetical protein
MKIARQYGFLILFLGLKACTSMHYVAPTNFIASKPELVEMLFQEPSRAYEVIAFVEAKTVFIWDTPEKMMSQCREEAAKVGADAVIFSSTGKWSGMPGIPGVAAGRAIKWKQNQ